MSWIDALVSNAKELLAWVLPFRVIKVYERGVVMRWGVPHRVMPPGFHWRIPFGVEHVEEIVVVEQTMDLIVQSITTKDDVAITLSANFVYCVVDPIAYHTAVTDFERSAEGYARIHLSQRARDLTWAELLATQKKLEASLEGTLTTRLGGWGAEVVRLGFTDLTRARPFRVFTDSNNRPVFG
jgi:membrane protease subunit HflK